MNLDALIAFGPALAPAGARAPIAPEATNELHATGAIPLITPTRMPQGAKRPVRASADELAEQRSRHQAAHRWVMLAVAGDLLVAALGSILAFLIRFQSPLQNVGHFTALELRQYIGYLVLGPVSLVAALAWLGIYRREMLLQRQKVMRRVLRGCVLWTLGFLLVALAFHIMPPISRIYMALNGVLTFTLLVVWRRWLDARLRSPRRMAVLQQRALLVGWNADAEDLDAHVRANPESSYQVIGWVSTGDESSMPKSEAPCLGRLDELEDIMLDHRADMVLLADLSGPRERSLQIAGLCEREMVQFKIIPSCFRIFLSGLQLETVAGTAILGVNSLPLDDSLNVFLKRCLDIVGGAIGLMLSAPVIALFGAIVWLESRGPIFYRQVRMGANGRNFKIIKIRSMKLNAESNGAQWATKDDPRRLRVGAFMRAWNIDELPQFWNVLKGEMSLVGPRPERPELIANFKHKIPHYNARHHAKPGLTGWAAVNGLRGDTDLAARIRHDIWYLEHWTLLLDFQIMLMTFFKRDNAY